MAAAQFPLDVYSAVHDEWLETRYVVIPTLRVVVSTYLHNAYALDVGCGTGFLSNMMLRWGAKSVHGIDTSCRMIEICHERYGGNPALHFTHSSIAAINYHEEFELVTAIFVLHFNEAITELENGLCAIYKSLKKGGKLVAFVPNGIEHLNSVTEDEGRKLRARLILDGNRRFDGERMIVRFYSLNGDSLNANNLAYVLANKIPEQLGFTLTPNRSDLNDGH